MLVAALMMGGGYLWLRQWLHSEDFREMLSAEAGSALEAEAAFGEFDWDGLSVRSRSFEARGNGVLRELRADDLSISIGLNRIRERVVTLRNASVSRIDARLDLRGEHDRPSPEPETDGSKADARAWYERFLPTEVTLEGLSIGRSSVAARLDAGDLRFAGTGWTVDPGTTAKSYEITGRGGRLAMPWKFVPDMNLERAQMRYSNEMLFLTDSRFRLYERGVLDLRGEAAPDVGEFAFGGSLRDVRADEVLAEDWKQRLTGRIESDFSVSNEGDGVRVEGGLTLFDGVLTGLPVLDSLGAYGGNPRFRRLTLSDASVDFHWEDGTLLLSDFRLGSEGLMRVEGRLFVDRDRRLDGRFRIGLTPGTLARIPGAETKVFLPGERGLLWTPLRVSGTLDDPREDLTARLIEAAGMRMFEILPETGERVLKYTRRAIDADVAGKLLGEDGLVRRGEDLLDQGRSVLDGEGNPLEKASDVVRQGEDVVREVSGIFDALRGRDPQKREQPTGPAEPPKPEKPPEK
jgi:hypothetical protein